MEDLCIFCNKRLAGLETVTVKKRGITTIKKCSIQRDDGLGFEHKLDGLEELVVHTSCRKSYINENMIKSYLKKKRPLDSQEHSSTQESFGYNLKCSSFHDEKEENSNINTEQKAKTECLEDGTNDYMDIEVYSTTYCNTCLSTDRELLPLGEYEPLYLKLCPNSEDLSTVWICWECRAVLRKVEKFQKSFKLADSLIQKGKINYIGNLSKAETEHTIEIEDEIKINYIFPLKDKKEKPNDEENISDVKAEEKKPRQIELRNRNSNITVNSSQDTSDFEPPDDLEKKPRQIELRNRNRNITVNSSKDTSDFEPPDDDIEVDSYQAHFISSIRTRTESEDEKNKNDQNNESEVESDENSNNDPEWRASNKIEKQIRFQKKPPSKPATHNEDNKEKGEPKYRVLVLINHKELLKWRESLKESESYKLALLKCDGCIKTFENQDELMEHVAKLHNQENPHNCDICHQRLPTLDKLFSHRGKHYYKPRDPDENVDEDKTRYQCLVCDLTFGSSTEHESHHKRKHSKQIYSCEKCDNIFDSEAKMEKHIRIKHGPWICKECNKEFSNRLQRDRHRIYHHRVDEGGYCIQCDITFLSKMRLKNHLALSPRHNSTPKKKYDYPCQECDKRFSKKTALQNHYELVHSTVREYPCDVCEMVFSTSLLRDSHKKRVHEGILPPRDKICHHCGKGFSINKTLIQHIRTHTGERPYKCPHCSFAFAQRSARNNHVKRVHKDTSWKPPTDEVTA